MALGTGLSFQYWDTTANKAKRIAVDDAATANVIRLYQVQTRELHVGAAGALNIMDTSGDSVAVFNSSGAHSIGKTGQTLTLPGHVVVSGNLTVTGTPTLTNWTVVEIPDNVIQVNSGPGSSKNAGYKVERYQAANDAGTGDVVTDAATLAATIADIGDQTGMTSTQVKLAGGSATDDYYKDLWLLSEAGEVRRVTAYNGTTKVATVASAWTTQPADDEAITIHTPYQAWVFDETDNVWTLCTVLGRSAADAIVDRVGARVGALTADDAAVFSGGFSMPDSEVAIFGTGSDFQIVHDGTNTVLTNSTGALTLDNTAATSDIVLQLGADNSATSVVFKNNSDNVLFEVDGAGRAYFKGGATVGPSGGNMILTGGMGGGMLSLRSNGGATANGIDVDVDATSYVHFLPSADSSKNLGSSSAAWATAYVDTLTSLTANDRVKIGTDAQVAISLPVFTSTERDNNIAAPAAGDFLYNSTTGGLQWYDGAAWQNAGAGAATGTTNLTYTVNSDASAASDEDPALILLGGDGVAATNDDIVRSKWLQDSSAEFVQFTMERNRNGGGYAQIAPNFQIGLNAGTADLAPTLQFNAGTGAVARTASIVLGGSGTDLVITGPASGAISAATNLDAEAGLDVTGAGFTIGASSSFSQTAGAFTYNVAASTFAITSNAFNVTAGAASTHAYASSLDLDTVGDLNLNSSAGAIQIGNDAVSQNINIGTAGARSVSVGSTTGGSSLTLQAGAGAIAVSGGSTFDLQVAGALTIDSSGGAISIGSDANAQAINVGTGAAARTITFGNSSGATTLVFNAGTGLLDFNATMKLVFSSDFCFDGWTIDGGLTTGEFAYLSANDTLAEATAANGGHCDAIEGVYNGTGLVTTGPVTIKKPSGEVWAAGDRVFVNDAASGGSTTAPSASGTDVREIGRVTTAAGNGTTTARILLDLSKPTVANP